MNRRSFLLFWIASLTFCLGGGGILRAADDVTPQPSAPPPLLLISLDGFRWDYCTMHPDETPRLRALMQTGISARGLVPVFPSNTFANHYTIVTGLYPSHHGIINNTFFDPTFGAFFRPIPAKTLQESRWWSGEPIWVTAIKQGRKSATSFWIGSEALIAGHQPTYWKTYDQKMPTFEERFEELFSWLQRPPETRPAFITFYFEETNSVGHKFGPGSPELVATIRRLDHQVGLIVDRLHAENIPANIVVVSDHGMTPISTERVILLDDYLDPASVQLDFEGPAAGLRPHDGDVQKLLAALAPLQHGKAYRVEDLPARFHVTDNPRNPPVWIVPDEGWEIYFRSRFDLYRKNFNKGDHGYDPAFPSMHGILIANGPSFKADGSIIDPVENVHLYNLFCAALGLTPAPNDGDDRLVRTLLNNR